MQEAPQSSTSPLIEQVYAACEAGDGEGLRVLLTSLLPAELAHVLGLLRPEPRESVWEPVDEAGRSEVLAEMHEEACLALCRIARSSMRGLVFKEMWAGLLNGRGSGADDGDRHHGFSEPSPPGGPTAVMNDFLAMR